MSLHAPPFLDDDGERIMVFGPAGIGKTFNILTVARLAAQTKSDAMFFSVDTDKSLKRMLADPLLRPFLVDTAGVPKNIESTQVRNWVQLNEAVDVYQQRMRPQDWLIVDLLTPCWQWVQDHFTQVIFGKDLDQYLLDLRKEMTTAKGAADNKLKRGGFEGFKDWPTINSMWGGLKDKLLYGPGNLYCTAGIDVLNSEKASREDKALYGKFGVKPAGQKSISHSFQTVLWQGAIGDNYDLVTIKDRSRKKMEGMVVGTDGQMMPNFAKQYLVDIAGWMLA
jgi:hypothetical protein